MQKFKGIAKKGEVRNPKGRPKGIKFMTEALKEIMESHSAKLTLTKVGSDGVTRMDKLELKTERNFYHACAFRVLALAMAGDMQAMTYIADRTDGKPTLQIEHTDMQTREEIDKGKEEFLNHVESLRKKNGSSKFEIKE